MSNPSPSECRFSLCKRFGFKPITKRNLLYYYAPAQGVVSYSALAVNVMNPSLVCRVFPKKDVTNILLFNTVLGTGLYLYSRPHMNNLTKKEKILYSAFGAFTFSLGSILLWAIVRTIVPQNVALCTLCGIGSGLALVKIGRNYVAHIDSLTQTKDT